MTTNLSARVILWFILSLVACQAHPDDLKSERNFLQGLELAKTKAKPIFLCFTGYGVMGYDEFSNDLVTDQSIQNLLNEHFITVLLHVDDKKMILENDTLGLHQIEFSKEGQHSLEKAKTLGHINSLLEIELFNRNSQPLYVIIDDQMNVLIDPFGYTGKKVEFFKTKLQKGMEAFSKKK